jgi:hypothetical protein
MIHHGIPGAAKPQQKKKFLAEAQRPQSDRAICTDWKLSAFFRGYKSNPHGSVYSVVQPPLVPLYKNPIMFARDLCCRHRWENDPLL